MMDRFAAMEVLVKVIDTGSFSAAARQLGVGQPAVSKTIAQLETRIGVKLLLRSTRGLSPTEAGQRYYEHAQRALDAAHEADLAATGAAAGLTGRLRFAAPVTFARLHLMPRLPAFIAQHPALAIDAILDDRRVDLIEESIDVALRIGTLADSTATAQRVGAARRIVVQPYLHDPNAERFERYTGKRYTFLLADAVPGHVAMIRTEVPGANGDFAHPVETETLSFQSVVRKLPGKPGAPAAKPQDAPRASR